MRFAAVLLLTLVGCATPHEACFTTLELSAFGSQSDGKSRTIQDRWENDDVTAGGSATLTFDFTGACERE